MQNTNICLTYNSIRQELHGPVSAKTAGQDNLACDDINSEEVDRWAGCSSVEPVSDIGLKEEKVYIYSLATKYQKTTGLCYASWGKPFVVNVSDSLSPQKMRG